MRYNDATLMFPVNSTNFGLIAQGKKKKYYRNIISSYTELFEKLFKIKVIDNRIYLNGKLAERTMTRKVRFCLYAGAKGQPTLSAFVHLSIEHGEPSQGGNPDILYYVLTIEELLEEI